MAAASAATPSIEELEDREQAVTPLELFFDLVFVLSLTQVTALMSSQPTTEGLIRGMLALGALWWAWVGYAWLTNILEPEETFTRLLVFAAMAALLVVALATPEMWGDNAELWVGGYLIVRAIQIILLVTTPNEADAMKAARRFAVSVTIGLVLYLVSTQFDGDVAMLIFGLALLIEMGGAGTEKRWRIPSPGHFAERHGLIVIIALGESIVAIGVGAEGVELDTMVVVVAAMGTALAATLWWTYFDVSAIVVEHGIHRATGTVRGALARDTYSFLHLLLIAGIILSALGLKKAIADVDAPLKQAPAFALLGGVAIYLLGHVLVRLRHGDGLSPQRILAAVALALAIPFADEPDVPIVLGYATAVMVAMVAYEAIVRAEVRHRVRATR